MNITKESIHALIDIIDSNEYNILYQLLMKFVPEDLPKADEIESIEKSIIDAENGDIYSEDEIDWDNLDDMNLD